MERADIAAALQPLVLTLTELAETVDGNSRLLIERDAERARELAERVKEGRAAEKRQERRSHWQLGLLVLLFLVASILGVVALTNRTVLDKINSVTGPAAQARSAAATRTILLQNAAETDCRHRRAQVRLPAPDLAPPAPPTLTPAELAAWYARYSCVAQTDPSVYPGTAGQPSR